MQGFLDLGDNFYSCITATLTLFFSSTTPSAVYVDLQYDEISLTFTAGSVCLCGVCSLWSVCEVDGVTYVVSAVVAVTVMHVLLSVFHVCMPRECEGARVTAMLVYGPGRCGCGECVYGWYTWFRCIV